VGILAATGVVDALSFGSEAGDIAAIKAAGRVLATEPPEYKSALRDALNSGKSVAAARGAALEACLNEFPEGLLTKPNNGLAMEYCKALHLLGEPLEVFTTHCISGGPSATRIRRGFLDGDIQLENHLPACALEILQEAHAAGETATLNDFSEIFRYLLCTREFNLGEGLENRFRRLNGNFAKLTDFLQAAKTKRYTLTRLQRAALKIILNITPEDAPETCPYIRILGFRKNSTSLLSQLTKNATKPVITNGTALDTLLSSGGTPAKILTKELQSSDIYRCATNAPGGNRSERGSGLVIV
jgi:predicted nucleotidyltransferase